MKKSLNFLVFTLATVLSAQLAAEACTYSEGLRAVQNGNKVRAEALMRMAAKDGDKRATSYLQANFNRQLVKLEVRLPVTPIKD